MITGNKTCMQCQHSLICLTVWGPDQMAKSKWIKPMALRTYFFVCFQCEKNHVWIEDRTTILHSAGYYHKDYTVPDACPRSPGLGTVGTIAKSGLHADGGLRATTCAVCYHGGVG